VGRRCVTQLRRISERCLNNTVYSILAFHDEQEHALDYVLIRLGVDTPTVDHPVIMTERLASPLHSRARVSTVPSAFPFLLNFSDVGTHVRAVLCTFFDICC
jgi:hypothetical protein